jgi:uncharacterized BrkB/YihY/UPF0761 family membrane protein
VVAVHHRARFPLVYGPLAGVMVLMVWLYFVALLVLVDAEVMRLVEQPQEVRPHVG